MLKSLSWQICPKYCSAVWHQELRMFCCWPLNACHHGLIWWSEEGHQYHMYHCFSMLQTSKEYILNASCEIVLESQAYYPQRNLQLKQYAATNLQVNHYPGNQMVSSLCLTFQVSVCFRRCCSLLPGLCFRLPIFIWRKLTDFFIFPSSAALHMHIFWTQNGKLKKTCCFWVYDLLH